MEPGFKEAFEVLLLPRLNHFAPELVIISAGFDAHMRDPLGGLNLVEADFAWATRALMDVADAHSNGHLISVLEGGYDLEGLARSGRSPCHDVDDGLSDPASAQQDRKARG